MDELLREQIEYYRERANEYDDWWSRAGRYAKGSEFERRWRGEVDEIFSWLDTHDLSGDVLEIAGGTGNFTMRLAEHAERLTVLDASPEVLDINRQKIETRAANPCHVDFVVADVFGWDPPRTFDTIFFGFWISHVPDAHIPPFFELLDRALAPGGEVLMADNRGGPADETGVVEITDGHTDVTTGLSERVLNDGRTFTIVKVYRDPDRIAELLGPLGWSVEGGSSADFFTWARATRS